MKTHCFEGRVKHLEERFEKRHVSGFGPDAVFTQDSIGWWVIFEGWPASMRFSTTKPDFEPGDIIDLTATKRRPHAPESKTPVDSNSPDDRLAHQGTARVVEHLPE